jgi:hypothetical protein
VDASASGVFFAPDENAEAYGEVVWSWRRDAGAKLAELSADDGDNKPAHRGEHEVSRKAIAQGMSDCLRCPVCSCAPKCAFLAHETAGAARTRHSLRPLFEEAQTNLQKLGQIMPRERGRTSSPHVVPAKAGTHTPRRICLKKVVDDFANTIEPCGYGSLLSQGRRWRGVRATFIPQRDHP